MLWGLDGLPSFLPQVLMIICGGIECVPVALTRMVFVRRCSAFFGAFVSRLSLFIIHY
jgi:hypothetical protein